LPDDQRAVADQQRERRDRGAGVDDDGSAGDAVLHGPVDDVARGGSAEDAPSVLVEDERAQDPDAGEGAPVRRFGRLPRDCVLLDETPRHDHRAVGELGRSDRAAVSAQPGGENAERTPVRIQVEPELLAQHGS